MIPKTRPAEVPHSKQARNTPARTCGYEIKIIFAANTTTIRILTMAFDRRITASFTGHRDLSPAEGGDLFTPEEDRSPEAVHRRTKTKLREEIAKLCEAGYIYFLCGMAQGFDLLAAEIVLEMRKRFPGIMLIAVVPYPEQAAGFSPDDKMLYGDILEQAGQTITISPIYTVDCFHRRNDFLVDNSSAVICFYNGTKGGTQYTVKRALKQGLKIVNTL